MRTLYLTYLLVYLIIAVVTQPFTAAAQSTAQPRLTDAIKTTLKTLPHVQGAPIADRTFDQKVVVVTFFASWCAPCREEFGHLREIYQTYHASGVEIIAVNLFENFDNLSNDTQLSKYLQLTKPPFSVVKGNDAISQHFGTVTRIPTLFVFDKQGRQAYHFFNKPDGSQSSIDLATLRQAITPLL